MIFFSAIIKTCATRDKGFSIMELIVAIGIFAFVVVAAAAVMIDVFGAQLKAVALKDVMDNARFTLELLTREIVTAANITYASTPPPGCSQPGLLFTGRNQGVLQDRFYYWEDTDGDAQPDAIMRVAMPSAGPQVIPYVSTVNCGVVVPQQFTSNEIVVNHWVLPVPIAGSDPGPTDGQPRVTIGFSMYSRNSRFGANTSVSVQTTVVQRIRDL